VIPLNLPEQDSMTVKINYQPLKNMKFVGEILGLKGILNNLEEKVNLLIKQSHKDHRELYPEANIIFFREAESYFIRANERANKLLYNSNLELKRLHLKIKKKEQNFKWLYIPSDEIVRGGFHTIIYYFIKLVSLKIKKDLQNHN
jgi:hypothetical protein